MVHISGQYFINKEQENIRKKENMGDFEMDKNGDFKESSKDKLNRAIASMCDEWLLIEEIESGSGYI